MEFLIALLVKKEGIFLSGPTGPGARGFFTPVEQLVPQSTVYLQEGRTRT